MTRDPFPIRCTGDGARRLRRLCAACLLVLLGLPSLAAAAGRYDLVILNGRVIDPASGLDAVRNVAITQDRIVRVTASRVRGVREIDARGLVVAPGFVDLHAHGQDALCQRLHAQDGVTTALELETGVFPVEPWYRRRTGASAINFGANASHGFARAIAFGAVRPEELTGEPEADGRLASGNRWRQETATASQRARMGELLAAQLASGGIGVGYHLADTPGADTDELTGLFAVVARHRALNMIHIRSVAQVTPTQAAVEIVAVAKATGAAVHVAHANSTGLWETPAVLATLDAGRASGADVTTEAYPYTGAHTSFDDPRASPERMADYRADYSDLEFMQTGERLTAATYAEYRQRYPSGELIAHVMKQHDVDAAVEHPGVMVASDGEPYHDGKGHPRSAGTFAKIFSRYVRERGTLTLSEALAKVSYLPAKRLEPFAPDMKLRGRIQPGAIADVTIFDADRIEDRATYGDAAVPSVGIAYVLVSGQAVVDDYRFNERLKPGRPVYGTSRVVAPARR